jgi:hypothetical protein
LTVARQSHSTVEGGFDGLPGLVDAECSLKARRDHSVAVDREQPGLGLNVKRGAAADRRLLLSGAALVF